MTNMRTAEVAQRPGDSCMDVNTCQTTDLRDWSHCKESGRIESSSDISCTSSVREGGCDALTKSPCELVGLNCSSGTSVKSDPSSTGDSIIDDRGSSSLETCTNSISLNHINKRSVTNPKQNAYSWESKCRNDKHPIQKKKLVVKLRDVLRIGKWKSLKLLRPSKEANNSNLQSASSASQDSNSVQILELSAPVRPGSLPSQQLTPPTRECLKKSSSGPVSTEECLTQLFYESLIKRFDTPSWERIVPGKNQEVSTATDTTEGTQSEVECVSTHTEEEQEIVETPDNLSPTCVESDNKQSYDVTCPNQSYLPFESSSCVENIETRSEKAWFENRPSFDLSQEVNRSCEFDDESDTTLEGSDSSIEYDHRTIDDHFYDIQYDPYYYQLPLDDIPDDQPIDYPCPYYDSEEIHDIPGPRLDYYNFDYNWWQRFDNKPGWELYRSQSQPQNLGSDDVEPLNGNLPLRLFFRQQSLPDELPPRSCSLDNLSQKSRKLSSVCSSFGSQLYTIEEEQEDIKSVESTDNEDPDYSSSVSMAELQSLPEFSVDGPPVENLVTSSSDFYSTFTEASQKNSNMYPKTSNNLNGSLSSPEGTRRARSFPDLSSSEYGQDSMEAPVPTKRLSLTKPPSLYQNIPLNSKLHADSSEALPSSLSDFEDSPHSSLSSGCSYALSSEHSFPSDTGYFSSRYRTTNDLSMLSLGLSNNDSSNPSSMTSNFGAYSSDTSLDFDTFSKSSKVFKWNGSSSISDLTSLDKQMHRHENQVKPRAVFSASDLTRLDPKCNPKSESYEAWSSKVDDCDNSNNGTFELGSTNSSSFVFAPQCQSKRSGTYYGSRLPDAFTSSDEGSEDDASATTDSDSTEDDGQVRSYLVGYSNGLCEVGGLATIAEDVEEDSGPEYSGNWMFSADNTDTDSVIHLPNAVPHPMPDVSKLNAILGKSDHTSSDETLVMSEEERIVNSKSEEPKDEVDCCSLIDEALEESFAKTVNDDIFDLCSLEPCETVSLTEESEDRKETAHGEVIFNMSATAAPFEQIASPVSSDSPSESTSQFETPIKKTNGYQSTDSEGYSSSDESPLKRIAIRDSITTKRKSKRPRRVPTRTRTKYPSTSSEEDTDFVQNQPEVASSEEVQVQDQISREVIEEASEGKGSESHADLRESCVREKVKTPEQIIEHVKKLSLIRPYSMGDIRFESCDTGQQYMVRNRVHDLRSADLVSQQSKGMRDTKEHVFSGHHSHILRSKRPVKPKRYQSLYNPDLRWESWHQDACIENHVTGVFKKERPKPLSLDMAEEFLSQENLNANAMENNRHSVWERNSYTDNSAVIGRGGASTLKMGVASLKDELKGGNVAKFSTTPHAACLPSAPSELPDAPQYSSQFSERRCVSDIASEEVSVSCRGSDLSELPSLDTDANMSELVHTDTYSTPNIVQMPVPKIVGDVIKSNGDQNCNKISHKEVTFCPSVSEVNWHQSYDEPDDTDFHFTQLEQKQVQRVKILDNSSVQSPKLRPIVTTVIPPKPVEGKGSPDDTKLPAEGSDSGSRPGAPIWQRLKLVKIGTPKGPRPKVPPKPASLSSRSSDGEPSESGLSSPDEAVSKKASPRFFSWGSKREKKNKTVNVSPSKNNSVLSESKINVIVPERSVENHVTHSVDSIENKENISSEDTPLRGHQSSRDSDRSSSGVTSPSATLSPVDSDSAFEDNVSTVSSDAKPPLPPCMTRLHPHSISKVKLLHARRQYFNRQAAAKAEIKQEPVKINIPDNSAYKQTTRQRSAAERLKDRFDQFSKSARRERERLASSTPDLSQFEDGLRKSSIDLRNPTNSSSSGGSVSERTTGIVSQGHDLSPRDTGHLNKTLSREFERASLRCRTRSIGILETDLDTGKSREFLTTKETNLDDVYQDIQDLLDSFPHYLGNNRFPSKRAKSLLHLDGDPPEMQSTLTCMTSEDSRAKSMEFLLDDDNRASVQAPENELQKEGERKMSEAELRVRRSLQRLDIPDWMKNTQAPQQGFLLRRNNTPAPQTSSGWTGLSSKAGSMTSLGSSRGTPSTAAGKLNLSARMSTRSYGGVTSPASNSSISPSASDRGTSFSYPFSRWSTSRLNSGTTTPTGSVTSQKNSYSRQPYLGWRSNTSLLSLAGSQSSLAGGNYLTPAERLALSIGPKKPGSPDELAPSAVDDRTDNISADGSRASDVQSSIKEVTSAIVHYCNASPHSSPKLSPKRRVWVESSFVGTKPITSPGTPANSILTPASTINGHQDGTEVSTSHSPGEYLMAR